MRERNQIFDVIDVLADRSKVKIASMAPSVRVTLSEEFGLPPGAVSANQIFEALRKLGFDYVFDTSFAADLTIMEVSTALIIPVVLELTACQLQGS